MDDTKRYTLQVKGIAYRFTPLDMGDLERVNLLGHMDVSAGVTTKAIMRLLKNSLGADEWDNLAMRFVTKEVEITELKSILERLVKKTIKDAKAGADTPDDE